MNEIYQKVSKQIGEDPNTIKKVYMAYWRAIKEYILNLPLKDIDNIDSIKTNINIPSLGKLHCTEEEFKNIKKRYEVKKDKTNV